MWEDCGTGGWAGMGGFRFLWDTCCLPLFLFDLEPFSFVVALFVNIMRRVFAHNMGVPSELKKKLFDWVPSKKTKKYSYARKLWSYFIRRSGKKKPENSFCQKLQGDQLRIQGRTFGKWICILHSWRGANIAMSRSHDTWHSHKKVCPIKFKVLFYFPNWSQFPS